MGDYDKKLREIDFFKLHPSYLPFVGEQYDRYKILQISESHYNEGLDTAKYGIAYFSRWFDEPCPEVETELLNNRLTRRVCEGVCRGNCFANFDNPLRSFMKVLLEMEDPHVNPENRQLYHHFAFMNFYQMPAFEAKGYFKKAFHRQAKLENAAEAGSALLLKCRQVSTGIVDQVIDILEPRAILFTSIDAWEQYTGCGGRYADDPRVIHTAHPGQSWHRQLAALGGRTSKEVLETRLKEIYH